MLYIHNVVQMAAEHHENLRVAVIPVALKARRSIVMLASAK